MEEKEAEYNFKMAEQEMKLLEKQQDRDYKAYLREKELMQQNKELQDRIDKAIDYIKHLEVKEEEYENEFLKDAYMIVPTLLSILDKKEE